MSVTYDAARNAARVIVQGQIEAGADSLASVSRLVFGYEPGFGCFFSIGQVSLARNGCRAAHGHDSITISDLQGVECCYSFQLSELYDEIKSGRKQLSLFAGVDGIA